MLVLMPRMRNSLRERSIFEAAFSKVRAQVQTLTSSES